MDNKTDVSFSFYPRKGYIFGRRLFTTNHIYQDQSFQKWDLSKGIPNFLQLKNQSPVKNLY